jgi:hypothetical protein
MFKKRNTLTFVSCAKKMSVTSCGLPTIEKSYTSYTVFGMSPPGIATCIEATIHLVVFFSHIIFFNQL